MVLQTGVVALFIGRAWQHWFWETPYRALFWDETWINPIVASLGGTWSDYVTSPTADAAIQGFIHAVGWFFFLCAITAPGIYRFQRISRVLLFSGAAGLIVLSALYYKEQFFFIGQLLEYTLQWSFPLFLLAFVKAGNQITAKAFFGLKVAIALTFVCHGLYAVGYYPVPGQFVTMTMNILGLDNQGARLFLKIAGLLDFVASALLFAPWKGTQKAALFYCAVWGLATSFARVGAFVYWADLFHGLHQWLAETLYRFPHFAGPVSGFLYLVATGIKPGARAAGQSNILS